MHRVFILLLTLILSVSGLAAQTTSAGPLQVIDTLPLSGEELGLREPITLFFDRSIDCATAESAISLTPSVAGGLSCDGASVTFTPQADYQAATTYLLTVAQTLQAADGTILAGPLALQLNTIGHLAVSEVLPDDGTAAIETDSIITVIFNRPVVPLVSNEDRDLLPDPLTMNPPVAGAGEWLNTSIYVFRPDPALAGGTDYTVTVNAGLTAVDGAVLNQPYTWSFRTLSPQLVEVMPEDLASSVRLDDPIQVTFNQAMDRASVEASFFLRPDGQTSGSVTGAFEWSDDSSQMTFTSAQNLALDTFYNVGFVLGGARSANGEASLVGLSGWNFVTVPLPGIVGTDPFTGEYDVNVFSGVSIYFASPMDRDTLLDNITIEPEPLRDVDAYYYRYDDSYNLNFPLEPSSAYTVTLGPGMEDVYGNVIERGRTITFTTAPYDPDVSLRVPGGVGFYNAFNDQTELFVTHRNVSRLDLSLFGVPTQDFVSSIMADSYDPTYNYRPAPGQLLSEWQIASSTPANQTRFELLNLGGVVNSSGGVVCDSAPPSRLKVGDSAIVITDPDPLRARSAPVDGAVIDQLYRDYRLSLIGGPVCANDFLWWEVQLRDERRAWVAEGSPDEYFLDLLAPGQTTAVTVQDGLGDESLAPGVYLLDVAAPETLAIGFDPRRHFLMVSTAALNVKSAPNEVLVWVTDVQTGQPIANVPLSIFERGRGQVASGVTDAGGLLEVSVPQGEEPFAPRIALLDTADHFGIGASAWSQGIETYQFGFNSDFPSRYRVYMYTDRPIYRPDQPVYFKGVVRRRDDVTYTPPTEFSSVPVQIFDDRGEIVFEQDIPLTPFGTFSGQFDLADDAPLGFWRINVELPTNQSYRSEGGGLSFSVAEFRVPEFQVEVTADREQVVQNDTITVLVDSQFFFGGAVSAADVDYSVSTTPYFFRYEGPGFYNFSDFNTDSGPGEFYGFYGEEIVSGSGTTDAAGKFMIDLPAELKDATQSQRWSIEATVRDESGLTVSGRTEVIVNKGLVYIGARPARYVSTQGQDSDIEIIAVDWDSQPVANQPVEVEVVERRWSSVQEEDESGRTTWTWEVEEIPVTVGSVMTDDKGRAMFTFAPPVGGIYRVRVRTRDGAANDVIAATTMWVSSRQFVAWRQQNSNRIDLVADQSDYNIGDTAEILITSPFQGPVEALITVERGSVLTAERVTMDSNSFVYTLPITDDYAPNVFVSALIVKGVDDSNPIAGFRMGMVELGVEAGRKVLTIDIAPDRERAGPRETVTYTIETTDWKGDPVQAEVGVGLTDLASLSVGDPNSGPILRFFYGEQGNGVRTSTPLTINTDQLTQTVIDTIKGGGGGGGGGGGIFDIRQDFVDTAYWDATVLTDASGRAEIAVLLPDNLTTWRLDARAVTSGADGLMLVGERTFDLLSTKPLLIRPVTPRFAVVDDVVTLAAVVNNNTDADMPVEVFIDGSGFMLQGDLSQTFTIPAGGRQRIDWPITVNDVEHLDLTFFANGGDGAFTDASKPPLGQGDERLIPVYKYEAPDIVGTAGLLREAGSRTEAISLPRRFDVTQGELTVSIDPSLAATTLDGLDYLRNFPHQCIEQTVSRFLPNIMTFRALDQLGVADAQLERDLNQAVNFALQRLMAQQKANGGWGWFVQDRANPLTTAYALIGLAEARDAGFAVDAGVIRRAQDFLQTTFIVPGLDKQTWELNRQTFILYALARSGASDVARTSTLFESRDRLDYYSKAFLALTLNIIDRNSTGRTDVLVSDLVNGAVVSATGMHWEEATTDFWNWNTDTRTTAIVLDALIKLRPESDLLPNVVRWLMTARRADAWETTQETAWALMALTDWMVTTGELNPAYTYNAALNGEFLAGGNAAPATVRDSVKLVVEVGDLLKDQANELVINRTAGPGVLYYTAHLRSFLPVPEIEPINRGIIVQRRYVSPETGEPITQAQVGDLIQVRLTIIAPDSLHYAVIEDPIPAGTEGVDPNLATSEQIGTRPGLDRSDPLSRGWGWWWFSNIEFRDEKVVLYSTFLPAGTYEYVYSIRAGLPGVYNVIPAIGYQFYMPEVFGRGAGSTFTVVPAE